jgi:hypothetical protein
VKSVALRVSKAAGGSRWPPEDDQPPVRLLLVRERLGELPWLVRSITALMGPVEVVQVCGLANALWRLGRERFDSVFLDTRAGDRKTATAWRQHIAGVTAIPVLDLSDGLPGADGPPSTHGKPIALPLGSVRGIPELRERRCL